MAGGESQSEARARSEERSREQATGVVDRTYFDLVIGQFKKNRLAVFGLRVITFLVLVAVFAPFLANSRPLVFHGYRYKSYLAAYDQLVYAHGDLFGVGRTPEGLDLPGMDEPVSLPGLGSVYQKEIADWDAGTQTWKQVRNVSFGAAEPLMNRLRRRIEEEIPKLEKDNLWARGFRKVSWLRKQGLPSDIERDLQELLTIARKNLDQGYRAKAELRQRSLLQQFKSLKAEVSSEDRKAIAAFGKRYRSSIGADFHTRDPATLAEFDELLVEIRTRLIPKSIKQPQGVTFEPHWDFPAIRQLEALEVLFILLILVGASVPLWGRFVKGERAQDELTRKAILIAVIPIVGALLWAVAIPKYSDSTDYQAGMVNGDLATSFRVMAPLRYGVNDNDPTKKWAAPWWYGSDAKEQKVKTLPVGATSLERDLFVLEQRIEKLKNAPQASEGGWNGILDFLNRHHMGTDGTGRDLTTRMIWGSRISLSIGFVAVGIYIFIGIVLGALAGYFGGWVDMLISRVIEVVICFPTFFLILTVIAFIGPSIWNIMVVIGITGWPGVARLVRGEFLRLRSRDFVTAGTALGFGDVRIIFRHILPNALAPVLVAATFGVASAILVESSLSFLGFGVKVPTPTWGSVLSSARESYKFWWITLFPGFAIFLTVTMYNLVGEGIRDAVDPKLRQ